MNSDSDLSRRLEELEIRYAFQEDLLRQLDEVMRAQARQIDALREELDGLRAQFTQGREAPNSPADEKPPHY